MEQITVSVRQARVADAEALSEVHDEAWRLAYRGIIPGVALEKMVLKRGPAWWRAALKRGAHRVLVLAFGDDIAGYANFGPSRYGAPRLRGEIYELYLRPAYQGVGLGSLLFRAARQRLADQRMPGLIVWALSDNEAACAFYKAMGGRHISTTTEKFGGVAVSKTGFGWK